MFGLRISTPHGPSPLLGWGHPFRRVELDGNPRIITCLMLRERSHSGSLKSNFNRALHHPDHGWR
jgi:hypothetical protein